MNAADDLVAAYAQVPEVNCRGLCWEACGPVPLARAELVQIRIATGRRVRADPHPSSANVSILRPGPGGLCSLLDAGRCSVYRVRPMTCRLYGAAVGLACPHGCRPTGRLVTREEALRLYALAAGAGRRPRADPEP